MANSSRRSLSEAERHQRQMAELEKLRNPNPLMRQHRDRWERMTPEAQKVVLRLAHDEALRSEYALEQSRKIRRLVDSTLTSLDRGYESRATSTRKAALISALRKQIKAKLSR